MPLSQSKDVNLEMAKEGDDYDPDAVIDASELETFDVTASYTFADNQYHVMLSEEGKVEKQVLVQGWDSARGFQRASPENLVIVSFCEYPKSRGHMIDLNDFAELHEELLPLSKHPSRLSSETTEIGHSKDIDAESPESIIGNKYIENAILSMYRGEEALVTLKDSGRRFYITLKDYDVKKYLCCVEGIEASAVQDDEIVKYCECHCGDYVCVAKDHTSFCKCCFMACGLIGLCAGAAVEVE